jgi:hypothetical protein
MQHKINFLTQIRFFGTFWSFQPMSFSSRQKRQFHHFISNKNPPFSLSFATRAPWVSGSAGLAEIASLGNDLERKKVPFQNRSNDYKSLIESILHKKQSGKLSHHSFAQNHLAPSANRV